MGVLVIILGLLCSMSALAADMPKRCGIDAFGNEVCMDSNGVLTTVPQSGEVPSGGNTEASSAASGVEAEFGSKSAGEASGRRRCGTDPFGNQVCE